MSELCSNYVQKETHFCSMILHPTSGGAWLYYVRTMFEQCTEGDTLLQHDPPPDKWRGLAVLCSNYVRTRFELCTEAADRLFHHCPPPGRAGRYYARTVYRRRPVFHHSPPTVSEKYPPLSCPPFLGFTRLLFSSLSGSSCRVLRVILSLCMGCLHNLSGKSGP